MSEDDAYPTTVWCQMHKGIFQTMPPTEDQRVWEWQEFVLPTERIRELEALAAAQAQRIEALLDTANDLSLEWL